MIIDICKIAADGMSAAVGGYGNSNSMHIFRSKLTRSAGLCGKEFVVMAGALLTTAPAKSAGRYNPRTRARQRSAIGVWA